jgi:hypothetical protein
MKALNEHIAGLLAEFKDPRCVARRNWRIALLKHQNSRSSKPHARLMCAMAAIEFPPKANNFRRAMRDRNHFQRLNAKYAA